MCLKHFFLLVVVVGVSYHFCKGADNDISTHEELANAMHWSPYNERQARECEENKIPYFVWIHPEVSFFSEPIAKLLNRKYLNALTATTNYKTFIFKYKTWDEPLIKQFWREAGHTKYPFLAFYHSGRIQAVFYANSDVREPPLELRVKVFVNDQFNKGDAAH